MEKMDRIKEIYNRVINGEEVTAAEAEELSQLNSEEVWQLIMLARRITEEFIGDKEVDLCSIVNAKSGSCSEDCKFCAQSAYYDTNVEEYSLLSKAEIISRAQEMEDKGADHFGIVTSGKEILSEEEFQRILEAVKELTEETGLKICASLGKLSIKRAKLLAEAGLERYHHNLETSANYFPEICSTHDYSERVTTVKNVKAAGLEVCCGGIIGLGESFRDRIELAFKLKNLDVDSVPINILNPVEGTPLEYSDSLPPLEILQTTAIFRFILPDKMIRYAGGREDNLRSLQPLGLVAGVNGLLVDQYLTTEGQGVEKDIQMVKDLGLM
ncbi:biotin synthase BioB [Acetohalobium arabaticum]|uniref:Biotin synthase n=1 Tax=Acetohalobium arabaticum (strain ATCC 49924 / DSM 5501 / Z-7288) TaxID=574087 RepID=D9QSE3_ACEAZ|nr:biotin synthase BioB [Acetohalobium arabaticum]ADL13406.1 biotin synthase [Acetohalobium arabaticum DSM 5501]